MNKNSYGIIGLGVMGRNLLYNIADNGFSIIGFDLDAEKTRSVDQEKTEGQSVQTTNDLADFVQKLETPRKVVVMVPAGQAVDAVLGNLSGLLEKGDIVIDGGNSYFKDTNRRVQQSNALGINFMGMGVSGGEQGARKGPSIMPGGNEDAYHHVKPMLEAISAKVGTEPCTAYMGKDAAGHYVKMVHNGIEYAIMQLISEAYQLLKSNGCSNDEMSAIFAQWNEGKLSSYLIEITRDILKKKDDLTEGSLVDVILDKAGSKGTGKWTSQEAMDIGVAIPTIDTAVTARILSSYKEERVKASEIYPKKNTAGAAADNQALIKQVEDALYVGVIVSYAQGLSLLAKASKEYAMDIPLQNVVKIWRGGCIIRSVLLAEFYQVYSKDPSISNILLDEVIAGLIKANVPALRKMVAYAAENGIALAGLQSVLAYFDAYSTAYLPINVVQAQRDFFGAHTYQRTDREGVFHTHWEDTAE
jgi:6-phosphogluconate dehydrogenase